MLLLAVSFVIGFFIGLVAGAKIYKNIDKLERWSRGKLKDSGVKK